MIAKRQNIARVGLILQLWNLNDVGEFPIRTDVKAVR